ncbi:MAG TPA: transposase [Terriglobales bacterium]
MHWGLYRFHQSHRPHFITFTCYRRQSYFSTPTRRDASLKVLERTRLRYQFFIYGFVVMPNHIHLLISEPQQGTIATVIQSLKIASAKRIKPSVRQGDSLQRPYNCQNQAFVGHGPQDTPFWQRRYYDRNVRDNEEFIQELKYIHRNPVKGGLVAQPEDSLWSSYRHYALDEPGIVAVESPWAAYKRKHPSADRNHLSRILAKDE